LNSLRPVGITSSFAYSINASGDIYGVGTDTAGSSYAVEWTTSAVPEPAWLSFLTAGLMLLVRVRRAALAHGDG